MAYVVPRRDRFEIRDSHATPKGPRSRTLATFTELTDEVLAHAEARAGGPLDRGALRESALRAGAWVNSGPADRPARELIAHLAAGRQVGPRLRRLLSAALARSGDEEAPSLSEEARAAAAWIGASPRQRGDALWDLLLLADAVPSRAGGALGFPALRSG
jgi:hypothetical protein